MRVPTSDLRGFLERGVYKAPWLGPNGEIVLLAVTSTRALAAPPLVVRRGANHLDAADRLWNVIDRRDPLNQQENPLVKRQRNVTVPKEIPLPSPEDHEAALYENVSEDALNELGDERFAVLKVEAFSDYQPCDEPRQTRVEILCDNYAGSGEQRLIVEIDMPGGNGFEGEPARVFLERASDLLRLHATLGVAIRRAQAIGLVPTTGAVMKEIARDHASKMQTAQQEAELAKG